MARKTKPKGLQKEYGGSKSKKNRAFYYFTYYPDMSNKEVAEQLKYEISATSVNTIEVYRNQFNNQLAENAPKKAISDYFTTSSKAMNKINEMIEDNKLDKKNMVDLFGHFSHTMGKVLTSND
ncbi:MAG: hypothetical protein LBQ34_07650 [Alphaproteobacteria bacterium]|jgi:hypothetical protein|nr:hypothetical protein [Alphaproteobacteria bacterium]